MAKRTLAIVLSGGGARGALQAGALHALFEAGIRPDLLVGTSIGSVNAASVALNGFNEKGLAALAAAWRDAAVADLLPSNYVWLTLRALAGRASRQSETRMRDFFIAHGISPEVRFADLPGPRLILVATDLNSGGAVLYGKYPHESVLEGVLASAAVPPWIRPYGIGERYLMDGGFVSSLPIEPALSEGATEIIALDLFDPRGLGANAPGVAPFLIKFMFTVQQRETAVELALAQAQDVPVRYVALKPAVPLPIWDFRHSEELFQAGYEIASAAVQEWQDVAPARRWMPNEWLVHPVSRLNRHRKAA